MFSPVKRGRGRPLGARGRGRPLGVQSIQTADRNRGKVGEVISIVEIPFHPEVRKLKAPPKPLPKAPRVPRSEKSSKLEKISKPGRPANAKDVKVFVKGGRGERLPVEFKYNGRKHVPHHAKLNDNQKKILDTAQGLSKNKFLEKEYGIKPEQLRSYQAKKRKHKK